MGEGREGGRADGFRLWLEGNDGESKRGLKVWRER